MPSLFVIQGRDQGQRYELAEPRIPIGRTNDNVLQLHDTEVSRKHAELVRSGDVFLLRDLNSSNGTFVNGKPVKERQLSTGDQIQLGRTLLLFTGVKEDSSLHDSHVDIIPAADAHSSRILHSISPAEGSDLLATPADQTQSPWLAKARSSLQVMYHTAIAISHTLDIDQLLARIMDLIFEWVEADRGCIMLKDDETGALAVRVRRQRRGIRGDERIAISKTILDYVVENTEGVLTSNAGEDERWDPAQSIMRMGVREAICVPMKGRYGTVGVIYIDTSLSPQMAMEQSKKFSQEHLKLMVAIAHQAALAVEDTSYYTAMVQAERLAAVGQTIATLSHHIKNILQGVRGGSYLIELGMQDHTKALGGDEEPAGPVDVESAKKAITTMRKGWSIVEKNQERISSLVMDMLTFSKEREPEPEPAELNEMVSDVVELAEVRAKDAGVELVYHPGANIPTLMFDPEAMHRAVLNIVGNAIDACEGCATCRVILRTSIDEAKRMAYITVEDTGIGIEKDNLERIFTVFVSKKGGRGTGLGLPVSRKILQEHGGRIRVASEPGKGSTFTLEFPLVLPPAEGEAMSEDVVPVEALPGETYVQSEAESA